MNARVEEAGLSTLVPLGGVRLLCNELGVDLEILCLRKAEVMSKPELLTSVATRCRTAYRGTATSGARLPSYVMKLSIGLQRKKFQCLTTTKTTPPVTHGSKT
jgi:hypothetical protein